MPATSAATTRAPGAAFFDVDETVIRVKSMFEFLRFWLARHGDDGRAYAAAHAELRTIAEAGMHRSHVNRAYYRNFAGVAEDEVVEAGADWYAEYRLEPDAFVTATLATVDEHRRAGDTVVFVSGSFRPVVGPLADDLGAEVILCSEPTVGPDGRYTGEVRVPMIGDNKGRAVVATIAARGLRAEACASYADHATDLEMLTAVGHPAVVGDDPVLVAHAARGGWPVLSPATGPHPATAPTGA